MLAGILLMVLATSMWGVSFVAPVILKDYGPIDITVGRYFFYGLVSLVIWLVSYRRTVLSPMMWLYAFIYAFLGHIGFSLLVTYGIETAGAEIAVPVIGLLPVCVSLFGNASLVEAPWRRILPPLILVSAGLIAVLTVESGIFAHHWRTSAFGVAAVISVVCMWTWYAISNARFLRDNPQVSSGAWTSIVGVATFVVTLLWLAVSGTAAISASELWRGGSNPVLFIIMALLLGFGASWLAGLIFNKASAQLPMALVGQLIVFETIFGVLYVYFYKAAIPPFLELAGMVLIFSGITWSIRVLQQFSTSTHDGERGAAAVIASE